jgi:hypothetical protein
LQIAGMPPTTPSADVVQWAEFGIAVDADGLEVA